VTIIFLFNKKVGKFFSIFCFGKSSFQFAKILVFILLNFVKQNDGIFNNSHTINLNNLKPPFTPLFTKGFPTIPIVQWDGLSLGDFNMTKKNKLLFLMDRFVYCHLFHIIFMFLLIIVLSFCDSMLFNLFPILWCHQRLDHPQQDWDKFNLHVKYESESILASFYIHY